MGQKYGAIIAEGHPWITYSDGNDGEPNHYRDFLDERGCAIYCDGEICELIPWDHPEKYPDEVMMSNEDNGVAWFVIPKAQFEADFVKCK